MSNNPELRLVDEVSLDHTAEFSLLSFLVVLGARMGLVEFPSLAPWSGEKVARGAQDTKA